MQIICVLRPEERADLFANVIASLCDVVGKLDEEDCILYMRVFNRGLEGLSKDVITRMEDSIISTVEIIGKKLEHLMNSHTET